MTEKSLDWLKEIEIAPLLEKDTRFIYECCGIDLLIVLWENFAKMTLHISTKPLMEAKKLYIRKHFDGKNVKELCRLLEVSDRFVYETVEKHDVIHKNQGELFNAPESDSSLSQS